MNRLGAEAYRAGGVRPTTSPIPNDALLIATAFAERIVGLSPGPFRSAVAAASAQSILTRWIEQGGSLSPALATLALNPSPLEVRAENLLAEHGKVPERRWRDIQSLLSSKGLRLRRRGEDQESGLLALISDLFVYEVLDARGKVLSEGKGWTAAAGSASALGEAVECQLAAQTPPTNLPE